MVIHNGVRYSPQAARAAGYVSDEQPESDEHAKHEAKPAHDKARRTTQSKGVTRGRDTAGES